MKKLFLIFLAMIFSIINIQKSSAITLPENYLNFDYNHLEPFIEEKQPRIDKIYDEIIRPYLDVNNEKYLVYLYGDVGSTQDENKKWWYYYRGLGQILVFIVDSEAMALSQNIRTQEGWSRYASLLYNSSDVDVHIKMLNFWLGSDSQLKDTIAAAKKCYLEDVCNSYGNNKFTVEPNMSFIHGNMNYDGPITGQINYYGDVWEKGGQRNGYYDASYDLKYIQKSYFLFPMFFNKTIALNDGDSFITYKKFKNMPEVDYKKRDTFDLSTFDYLVANSSNKNDNTYHFKLEYNFDNNIDINNLDFNVRIQLASLLDPGNFTETEDSEKILGMQEVARTENSIIYEGEIYFNNYILDNDNNYAYKISFYFLDNQSNFADVSGNVTVYDDSSGLIGWYVEGGWTDKYIKKCFNYKDFLIYPQNRSETTSFLISQDDYINHNFNFFAFDYMNNVNNYLLTPQTFEQDDSYYVFNYDLDKENKIGVLASKKDNEDICYWFERGNQNISEIIDGKANITDVGEDGQVNHYDVDIQFNNKDFDGIPSLFDNVTNFFNNQKRILSAIMIPVNYLFASLPGQIQSMTIALFCLLLILVLIKIMRK